MSTFDMQVAVKTIGSICQQYNISLEELRVEFPNRPTNETEAGAIASWIASRISKSPVQTKSVNPPRPTPQVPFSQVELPVNVDKNGKPRATRYALRGEDGEVKFYRVKAGRKPGFYFVDVQASDDTYPIKNRQHKEAIISAIAEDPDAALALYGQEIGACGRCGRTLTSGYRKLGIGPICIDK